MSKSLGYASAAHCAGSTSSICTRKTMHFLHSSCPPMKSLQHVSRTPSTGHTLQMLRFCRHSSSGAHAHAPALL
jgi:hypothetical protein